MHDPVSRTLRPVHGRGSRTRGFTILEVALASTIMALGIASSIVVMQAGFKAVDVARDNTLASQILQSEMERLRLMAWDNPSTTARDSIRELPETETVALGSMFTTNTVLASRFEVVRTVTPDSSRPNDIRYITISVTWRTLDGRTQTRSFRSMYAKNGLYDYYTTVAAR
jgi:Tfp pilus assembly protein PilV